MTAQITPLAVGETTAARMLDMKPAEFRHLVATGALPPPVTLAGFARWRVEDLRAIVAGDAAKPDETFEI